MVSAGLAVVSLFCVDRLDARDFQSEIDAAAAKGGGVVRVESGEWVTHGLQLKSGVTLELAEGARLVATTNLLSYANRSAFIYAENATNIAIVGKGTIYGSGDKFIVRDNALGRPVGVCLKNCRNFRVEGVRLEAPAFWTLRLFGCDGGVVRGITIFSRVNFNNDGIDIEAANLLVEDCDIDSDDDAICFKSDLEYFTVENVEVRNCRLSSSCNAIKFGTSWVGKGRSINVHDCSIRPRVNSRIRNWHRERLPGGVPDAPQCLGGIVLESVDGGWLEDVTIRNITMEGVQTPIVVREAARRVNPQRETRLRNILIENVTGTCLSRIASSITGIPGGKRPQNITLRNVNLTMPGGATEMMRLDYPVPEAERSYPENRMFNHILPAWGIYVRHVDGVRFENVRLNLSGTDVRPHAVVYSDVTGLSCTACNFTPQEQVVSLVDYVDPFTGTAGTGHTHPSAACPFGMVQAGPDTGFDDWAYCPGYQYRDKAVLGYSLTHLSGTGCPDYNDVQILPFSGALRPTPMRSAIEKSSEEASPGYYCVFQTEDGVGTEITATKRAAIYRFSWKDGAKAKVLLNLNFGQNCPKTWNGRATIDGNTKLSGSYWRNGWISDRRIAYAFEFDHPWTKLEPLPKNTADESPRYVASFDLKPDENLLMKVGLSTTGEDGARKNLVAEIPGWDFDGVRKAARASWEELLARSTCEGTDDQKRNWYTALYHLYLQPNDYADVDGCFSGADNKIYASKDGTYMTTLSLWDTFRAAQPWYTITMPEIVEPIIHSMLSHYQTYGRLPVMSYGGHNVDCMVGNHSIPVIVDAYLKGFRNFDAALAFEAITNTLTVAHPGKPKEDWDLWDKYGYFPCDIVRGESVSRGLECAYGDWCAAVFAMDTGHDETAAFFAKRAQNWKNTFDSSIGFGRGKTTKGEWRNPFDPYAFGHGAENDNDFTEGNAFQYSWHVMQDVPGLVAAMGGRDKFVERLDALFTTNPQGPDTKGDTVLLDISGMIGQYVHGNEPSHHVIYFYPQVGCPDKAAERIREVIDTQYHTGPTGLCGNDDCGQMSAWYVFSAVGFYPFNPCGGEYVIGAPQVPKATLKLANGKTFTMTAKGLSKENKYVKSVTLNGKAITDWKLRHEDIVKGGELVFEMTSKSL